MTWLSKVRELEERLAEDCAAFDGQETSLVFVAESAKPESRIHFLKALKPLQHRSGMTMLARLSLPNGDQECHLVEVNITGPDAARTSFAELTGKAGLLIPENVISSLDRFEPSKGKMTARGRFIALLWQLECNRRIEAGDSTWLGLDDEGREFVFGIPDPFRLARLLLRCFRENPAKAFVLPGKVRSPRRRQTVDRRLTAKQLEASKLHGECEGNLAEVARRMGVDRSTAKQHVDAAFTKLGKIVGKKVATKPLKTDHRGNVDVKKEEDHRR